MDVYGYLINMTCRNKKSCEMERKKRASYIYVKKNLYMGLQLSLALSSLLSLFTVSSAPK